jgi:2-methylisocitrate lyase-like PEP mutase family enzyme
MIAKETMGMTGATKLRQLLERSVPAVVPLALDPLSAKLAESTGFQALYLGGGMLGYRKTSLEANPHVNRDGADWS